VDRRRIEEEHQQPGFDRHPVSPLGIKWIKGWIKWIQASRSWSINIQIKSIQVDQDLDQTKSQVESVPYFWYIG